jgi:hypothetical protein
LVDELLIPEAEVSEFKFQNVHRLGERRDGKERSIIARFTRYSDHERVRSIAAGKLKAKPQFTVYQQYPREIYERRRNLIPKMKEWGSPTIFTLIGGACVPSVITFGTPRLASIM